MQKKRSHCKSLSAKEIAQRSSHCQNKPKQRSTNQVTVGDVNHEVIPPEQSPSSDLKDEETYTLFSLAGKTNPIIVTVNVNSQPIQMEVDTGAALSIISKTTFESTFPNQMLKPLHWPNLTCLGNDRNPCRTQCSIRKFTVNSSWQKRTKSVREELARKD